MSNKIAIIGAGMAGLMAAHRWKDSIILDAATEATKERHAALLRFRSDAVSDLTGIPFKRVTARKGVYSDDMTRTFATVQSANAYSLKVTGGLSDRSLWNLGDAERWIAPDDFYDRMLGAVGDNRIHWNSPLTKDTIDGLKREGYTIVSTAPMAVNLAAACVESPESFEMLKGAPIQVIRFKMKVPSDVYQTIYFPSHDSCMYRASISGDTVIMERVIGVLDSGIYGALCGDLDDFYTAMRAFGIPDRLADFSTRVVSTQVNGKLSYLSRDDREGILHQLTAEHGLYSLGRFATWRPVLLDDLIHDMDFIERLMKSSAYARTGLIAKRKDQ